MKAEIILTLNDSDFKKLSGVIDDLKAVTGSKEVKTGKFKMEFV